MRQHLIENLDTSALKPRATNPRTHSKKQIKQIADAIKRFGFTNPILIDRDRGIIAGHGRVEAAKSLGMTQVPTLQLADLSEDEVRAYVIADNKLAENAGWDRTLLGIEFKYLSELDLDMDLTITGFEMPEIDIILSEFGESRLSAGDEVIEPSAGPAVTKEGDVWLIGQHRVICGDSTKPETYQALLGDQCAQLVFTDPPYNVPVTGHVCGNGAVQHREFAMASGEMNEGEFTGFLTQVFKNLVEFSNDGAIHFQCMDWRHSKEIIAAGTSVYSELKNICVWSKTNGGMGSLYRSQHEFVFVFKSGRAQHINNVELGKHGRNRTNIWEYPGVNSFGANRDDLALHPTVKPVALVADAIRDCSHRGGIVLDAFLGSGTTLLAAEQTKRRGFGIEIDPVYCDVTIRRMQSVFGLSAIRERDDATFDEAAQARS